MSSKWKILIIGSLVFNFAVLGTLAFGLVHRTQFRRRMHVAERPPHLTMEARCNHLARHMRLPCDKAECFEMMMVESNEQAVELKKSLWKARDELMELLEMDEPDRDAVMGKVEEISTIQGELEKLLVQGLLQTYTILDREERIKLLNLLKRRMTPGCPGPGPGRPRVSPRKG